MSPGLEGLRPTKLDIYDWKDRGQKAIMQHTDIKITFNIKICILFFTYTFWGGVVVRGYM